MYVKRWAWQIQKSGDEGKSWLAFEFCSLSDAMSYSKWQAKGHLFLVTLSHFQYYAQYSVEIPKLCVSEEP